MAVEAQKIKTNAVKKRKQKSARRKLVEALDSIVSLIVRARDKQCVLCGTRERLTCGHLFSRTNHSTRWSLLNCHTQCVGCNMRHEHDPYPYTEWFRRKFGDEAYHALYQEFHKPVKFSDMELKAMLADYQKVYKRLVPAHYFEAMIYYVNNHPDNKYTFMDLLEILLRNEVPDVSPDFVMIADEIRKLLHE